jgi:hypothetical protein
VKIVLTGVMPITIVPVVKLLALATAVLVNRASERVAPDAATSAVPAISRARRVRLRRRFRRGVRVSSIVILISVAGCRESPVGLREAPLVPYGTD